ncbi:hypothetical protein ACU686_03160 [Yinghuangia aomiensis]
MFSFVAGDEARNVHGAILHNDGGLTTRADPRDFSGCGRAGHTSDMSGPTAHAGTRPCSRSADELASSVVLPPGTSRRQGSPRSPHRPRRRARPQDELAAWTVTEPP